MKSLTGNKWLLVNVTDAEDFCSHCLNRDVWREKELLDIIPKLCIFYQWNTKTDNAKRIMDIYKPDKIPCIFVVDPNTNWQIHEFIVPDIPQKITGLTPGIKEFLNDYPSPYEYWQEQRLLIYGYIREQSFLEFMPMEIIELIFKWFCPATLEKNEKISQQNKILYKMNNTEFINLVEMAIMLSSDEAIINQSKTMRYFKSNIGPKYFTTLTRNTFCNQMEYINMNRNSAAKLFNKIRDLMEF